MGIRMGNGRKERVKGTKGIKKGAGAVKGKDTKETTIH
jgi:hypothetical protein